MSILQNLSTYSLFRFLALLDCSFQLHAHIIYEFFYKMGVDSDRMHSHTNCRVHSYYSMHTRFNPLCSILRISIYVAQQNAALLRRKFSAAAAQCLLLNFFLPSCPSFFLIRSNTLENCFEIMERHLHSFYTVSVKHCLTKF